jgi:hypothetical protein
MFEPDNFAEVMPIIRRVTIEELVRGPLTCATLTIVVNYLWWTNNGVIYP